MIQQTLASLILCLAVVSGTSPASAQGPQGMQGNRPDPHTILGHLDWDDNGKISRDEAVGPLKERFNELDRNNDGYLEISELSPPRDQRQFEERDLDDSTPQQNHGKVLVNTRDAMQGYTLFAPMGESETYLIDMNGDAVQTWRGTGRSTGAVYLLDNGNLLRMASAPSPRMRRNAGPGSESAMIQEIAPSGDIVWEYTLPDDTARLHHDIEPMPNGNVLLLASETKDEATVRDMGGDPRINRDGDLQAEYILEIRKAGRDSGEVVWEWHTWDHLIQNNDREAPHYGDPSRNPQRVDLNYNPMGSRDWQHANSVDYDSVSDQIVLSLRSTNEIWIIDHSTSTAQAASSSGGRMGRGGDILFRWGNPAAYGGNESQVLYGQHDARWIPDGSPGAGHLLIFNNGNRRIRQSDVLEIAPDNYSDVTGLTADVIWSYDESGGTPFFADHISGAERLANGNTLICEGTSGHLFEVTDNGRIVWEYQYGSTSGQNSTPNQRRSGMSQMRQGMSRQNGPMTRQGNYMGRRGGTSHIFRATRISPTHPGLAVFLNAHTMNTQARNAYPILGIDL